MAAKGGIWTKNGFVKAANRKDNAGGVAVAEDDPATKLNSRILTGESGKESIIREAEKLYEIAEKRFEKALDIEKNYEDGTIEKLDDNQNILAGVFEFLDDNKDDRLVAGVTVKDKNGKTQAVAAVDLSDDSVRVEYLATHPDNVFKDNPKRVSGSGTQALARVAKLAQQKGKPVKLFSLDNAKPFYEKLGFKPDPPGTNSYTLKGSDLDKLAERAR